MALRAAVLFATVALSQGYIVDVPGLGSLNGTSARYAGVAAFLGIPYAKPPVGALRWQPPARHGAWQSPRDATKFGNACIQPPGLHAQPISEDCLFLNLATPVTQLDAKVKLPTMYWIHGGAYTQGEAAGYAIDALVAASGQKVVVAAGNYRLGFLGFGASTEVQARSVDGSAGNFGLQDQQLAMAWVRDHVAAFGGDGSRMTVFGESAGGNSVMNHLALPGSGGLFHRAILESGTYNSGAQPLVNAQKDFKTLLQAASCKDFDCLLTANATLLMCHMIEMYPVVDGVLFNASAGELIQTGRYLQDVDVLLGSNRDEFAMFTFGLLPKNVNEIELDIILEFLLRNPFHIPKVRKVYAPNGDYEYPVALANRSQKWWQVIRMATDGVGLGVFSKGDKGVFALGHCGARQLARNLKAGGTAKVYQYLFAKGNVVAHGDEIGFVFGDVDRFKLDSDKELAKAMATYWSNFAISGNPNSDDLPEWPEYGTNSDQTLRFDETIHVEVNFRADACDYWEAHPTHINPNELPFIGNMFGRASPEVDYAGEHVAEAPIFI